MFHFDQGCVCSPAQTQALCAQHAFKASPIGTMELVTDLTVPGGPEDLTVEETFTAVWMGRCCDDRLTLGSVRK